MGFGAVGYVGAVYAESYIHQADESRNFERALAQSPALARKSVAEMSVTDPAMKPRTGSMIGKIWIPRLGITAIVDEGINRRTLSVSVGHIPSTALPGQSGNVGIAGHRDTFFRSLRKVQRDDLITFTTLRGDYRYRVVSIKVVGPDDVAVLESHGATEILTLVTCYPFYYVGSAPDRFIVRAERIT
jgi:sortase A